VVVVVRRLVSVAVVVVVVGVVVVVVAVGLVRSVRERMLVMVSKEVMKEGDASNCNLGDLDKARRNCKAVVVWSRFRLLVEVSLLAGRRGEGLVAGTRGEGSGGR
jgi:hypothetical protein